MSGVSAMLRDIEFAVECTREQIGRAALAPCVMAAMAKVPRDEFVPDIARPMAFADGPLPIGHGQTISQPYIVALMTDLVNPTSESVVLEVGTGSGYQAAILAEVVKQVYSLEIIRALALEAGERLKRLGYGNVIVRYADGCAGWAEHAPYDGIVVTAAAPRVPPALIEQLKVGGRLVIPVGPPGWEQDLRVVEKLADGTTRARSVLPVAFVPMTGDHGYPSDQ
jgi:protein-L-isoaspartate(D-aspartate) O-methyltransferase